MATVNHRVVPRSTAELEPYIGAARRAALDRALSDLADVLDGRTMLHATGDDRQKGGVFEILRTVLPYVAGAAISTTWIDVSVEADARPALELFHVLAHGRAPAGEWRVTLEGSKSALRSHGEKAAGTVLGAATSRDVVFLHDTQTALAVPQVASAVNAIAWCSHIGTPDTNDLTQAYWATFGPAVASAYRCIFYLGDYVPTMLADRAVTMLPSVDPSLPKNVPVDRRSARAALVAAVDAGHAVAVTGKIEEVRAAGAVAVQVSRWDPLKRMDAAVVVLGAVAARLPKFHGLVVGPAAQSASEVRVLESCISAHESLPPDVQKRVHVLKLPRSGSEEHDEVVRAAQCAADIVLQMSEQEGFGLTVTEALVKGRPVVASDVGGIRHQLDTADPPGVLLATASTGGWVDAMVGSLDPVVLPRLSRRAHSVALEEFVVDRHLVRLAEVTRNLVSGGTSRRR